MKGVSIALSLTAANFIYQAFAGQHWDVAAERSFFQAAAVAITLLNIKREWIWNSNQRG